MNILHMPEGRRRKPPRNNKSLSNSRLVEVVKVFPNTGARLVKVHFVWPCFNCKRVLDVDRHTFQQLESRVLLGIKCGTCLEPPKPGLLSWVA